MLQRISIKLLSAVALLAMLAACAGPVQRLDYTAFKRSQPKSILVLPPVNNTNDVKASFGVLSQVTQPLAESGYYVVPVGPMEETFKYNGLTSPNDIAEVSPAKLREIFGADSALYMTVTRYGTTYQVIDSVTAVSVSAKLVDLRTGDVLWTGSQSATDKELGGMQGGVQGGGMVGLFVNLAQAAVKQIAKTVTDESVDVAGLTNAKLLSAGSPNGLLYGPRSPKYGTD
ncbi:DUF799 domain-containing protein [Burkholderia glumae]|uniref:DUF799 domain-containing protein n=2 Tax=Burkholderia glumae TaxID=337 RepID=A0AAQ0BRE1_BURGL|nr:DUF799 domain-containing protein [Burkholderia glumae]ACR32120.1 Lipoprotein [Burkholderia glumae BGR1]AJY63691.1 hypothetical protein KS03_4148 [Burkholderia glumae LMG 2196 = ATCC 33617]KHJ64491.1 lipoprotein [Burkholderia glumae]MCM2484699.1 DUF799 domain-containing protein [Burkholderia glumae]MCM2495082.1 DUF799 domain-containing protein [Burkholderia glumae]